MNDELTDRLSRQLHDQVDGWHDTPLTLEGVQGRARTIRRRRRAMTSGVVAAAVLAVAVPAGIGLSSRTDSTPDFTNPSPTEAVEEQPSAIGLPYLEGRTLVLPSGEERQLPGRYDGAVVLGDTVLAVAQDRETGEARLVHEDGSEVPLATTTLATNSDASAVAYVRADDHVVVESFDGAVFDLGEQRANLSPVSLVGGPDCSAPGSCAVWVNRGEGGFEVVQNGGPRVEPPPGVKVQDVATDGRVSVVTRAEPIDGGSCSAVFDGVATDADSCTLTYGRFSPDGAHLSAGPADEDGAGASFVAILQADGEEVVRFEPGRGGFVFSSTWEDSTHLLVTTYDYEKGWSVVRLGTDGTREVVLGPRPRGDDVTPAYGVLGPTG
ncbi:hypothetical protein GCM10009623_10270 [Nocardioides aestuarii]|uniref:WD40 repeat domain-containing protein n=1 Tax=Nocardioides aestuarii TaxID=252231 RepID=A0ABW4TJP6_9ACTN